MTVFNQVRGLYTIQEILAFPKVHSIKYRKCLVFLAWKKRSCDEHQRNFSRLLLTSGMSRHDVIAKCLLKRVSMAELWYIQNCVIMDYSIKRIWWFFLSTTLCNRKSVLIQKDICSSCKGIVYCKNNPCFYEEIRRIILELSHYASISDAKSVRQNQHNSSTERS